MKLFAEEEKELMLMDLYGLGLLLGLAYHCYTDMRYMLLYDSTNCCLALLGLWRGWSLGLLREAWQGFFLLGLLMLLVYLASRGGMGEGDVKLAAVLGLWLGVEQGLACLLLAFVSGAIIGGSIILLQRTDIKKELPFGPYLAISALACYVYGAEIIAWYGKLMRI
ncbi:MAG: prepilin peptidase [Phascolarctobacterium sp.]